MWTKLFWIAISAILLMIFMVSLFSPKRRQSIHQFFVFIAKIILIVAILGAIIAYYQR